MSQQKPNEDNRLFAILAYILPVIGGIVGLAVNRDNSLTRTHGQQSIGAVLTMIVTFFTWVVVAFFIALVPSVGPIISIALFGLVIAIDIFIVINWIISFVFAMRGKERVIPLSNRLVVRILGGYRKAKPVKYTA